MCYSATANFVGGTLVAGVGVATLTHVQRPRELALGSLPLSFGTHQLLEGVVWLHLQGEVPADLGRVAGAAYLLYAQALLPLLAPVAVLLVTDGARRRWLWGATILGGLLATYIGWTILGQGWIVDIDGRTLDYHNDGLSGLWLAGSYVALTVGPFLISGQRFLVGFGVLNLVGLSVVLAVRAYAFTSIWCAYAAVVSIVLYAYFHRRSRPVLEGVG